MIIGIDIDDTITDTYEVMMTYAAEYTAKVLKNEPILNEKTNCTNHFYMRDLNNWENGEDYKFLEKYYEKIIKEVRPKTLALKYLNKLHNEGNKIVLITARWESNFFDVRKTTENWIRENNIPCDKLIINAENKLVAAKNENVDIFIDDSFKNCTMVQEAGIKTYLMDTRVNRGLTNENIKRVYSWPHFYYLIKNK